MNYKWCFYLLLQILINITMLLALSGCSHEAGRTSLPETAMERVVKNGKIRCSYLVYSSYFQRDANSGKLSGIFHDVMEEIGKNANLKIEWAEEVGYENIFPGLQNDRYDVFCGGLWPNASRAKAASFTVPIFYSPITAWCRTDDRRFIDDLRTINSPTIKIATIDGAMEDIIAKADYPQARRISLPELSPFVQNLTDIVSKKADVTFAEPMVVRDFLATNPGTLREITQSQPVRIFGNSLVVKQGENALKDFLDVGLQELVNSGKVAKIIERYEPHGATFYPLARPYALPPRAVTMPR